jgi:tetratricopeptide (TPR) repeat protein
MIVAWCPGQWDLQVLGPNHPHFRNTLADAYQETGPTAEAIPLYERTLTDCERVLGPEHPDTLASRNNLAYTYQEADGTEEAISLFERALTDRERVLGPDHPDTLLPSNNLAHVYKKAGRIAEAESLRADVERRR